MLSCKHSQIQFAFRKKFKLLIVNLNSPLRNVTQSDWILLFEHFDRGVFWRPGSSHITKTKGDSTRQIKLLILCFGFLAGVYRSVLLSHKTSNHLSA